ncbi:MAG TPA: FxsA family protein [Marmoricola sp.]|nr:FxsA family protein [Marmoricola sp.]
MRSVVGVTAWALPIAEIVGIIWVGHEIGAGWTLLMLFAGIVLGLALIQRAGQRSVAALAASVRRGQVPSSQLAQNGWLVAGGVLLMIPGFITDILAILVMVPLTRRLLGRAVAPAVPVKATWVPPTTSTQGDDAEPTVIRGDVL